MDICISLLVVMGHFGAFDRYFPSNAANTVVCCPVFVVYAYIFIYSYGFILMMYVVSIHFYKKSRIRCWAIDLDLPWMETSVQNFSIEFRNTLQFPQIRSLSEFSVLCARWDCNAILDEIAIRCGSFFLPNSQHTTRRHQNTSSKNGGGKIQKDTFYHRHSTTSLVQECIGPTLDTHIRKKCRVLMVSVLDPMIQF